MRKFYLVAIVVIAIDQITKWLIIKQMELRESIPIIENFFYITSHRNKGAAWGILQDQMLFFYIITVIVVIGIIYYMEKHLRDNKFMAFAFSLILGGAIGNFIDRLFRKEVVDFLDVYIFTYDYPVFNVADMALVIGVALVVIATFIEERKNRKESNA
ncbi:MAG TPA: signal peptidase II [Bacillota bacterium]|nr:signal peptidase II [Bacillota bacterium]